MQQDPRNEANRDQPYGEKSSRFAADDHLRRIRVSDILFAIRKRITLIVILGVIGLVVGIMLGTVSYLRGEMSKQYLITTSIAVTSQNASGMFISDAQKSDDPVLNLARQGSDPAQQSGPQQASEAEKMGTEPPVEEDNGNQTGSGPHEKG